jgi:hypothetical protein
LKKIAFVLGNGTSRRSIDLNQLKDQGTVYGCNALYREFDPDYLIAVDTKMILEINKAGYQHSHSVWTNPNRAYHQMNGFNFFNPSKGWSSGPTALWLASTHNTTDIYMIIKALTIKLITYMLILQIIKRVTNVQHITAIG